jgi:putative hydrolase of the HAD superfamily
METAPETSNGVLATGLGVVRGVLFDIDDTLVDLEFAMTAALRDVSEHLLPELDEAGWDKFGRIFTRETTHIYDRYLAGELSFNEQRLLRGRAALGHFGVELDEDEQAHHWVSSYASRQHGYIRAFDDVTPMLDALDAAGVPYGAVSNNVHDYQRVKLETLYVGDNRLLDAEGSTAAGLLGVWLNRGGEPAPGFLGREVGSLLELLA